MNSYRFTLHFDGMCAFADRAEEVEAYVLFGHGEHSATLILPADVVDQVETTWKPTSIGVILEPDGTGTRIPRQVGIWSLHGEEATFIDTSTGETSPQDAGRPNWKNRNRLIEFAGEHPQSFTWPKDVIRKIESRVGVVKIQGRNSMLEPAEPTDKDLFVIKKAGSDDKPRYCSRRVSWTPAANYVPTIINRAKDRIALRTPSDADIDAWACVSNSAPVLGPEGLKHFHHYYIGVKLAKNDPITIQQDFVHVWDCVPLVAWS